MLKLLQKIASGATHYSAEEQPQLVDYFRHFAEKQRPEVLAQIWPHIPAARRSFALTNAISGVYYEIHANPDRGALKFLLERAEELNDPEFWQDHFPAEGNDGEMFSYIVNSGSEASIDLLVQYAERYGGKEAVVEMLRTAGFGFQHIYSIDKLIALSQKWGGNDLVHQMIDYSYLSLDRIIYSHHDPDRSKKEKIEAAMHLVKRQYELGGAQVVAQSFEKMVDCTEEEHYEKDHTVYLAVLQGFMDIGGNKLVEAVFSHKDYKFVEMIAAYDSTETLSKKIEDLAVQTQNPALIEGVRKANRRGQSMARSFGTWADDQMVSLKSGEFTTLEKDETGGAKDAFVLKAYSILAEDTGHVVPKEEKDLAQRLSRLVLATSSLEDFLKMSELHKAIGDPGLIPMALENFESVVKGDKNLDTLCYLADYVKQQSGSQAAMDLLTKPIKAMEGNATYEPMLFLIANRTLEEMRAFLAYAESLGGKAFVDRLIMGADGKAELFHWCHVCLRGDTGLLLLEALSPETRKKAHEEISPDWQRFINRELPKRAFYQAYTRGKYRWLNMTGKDAPHPSLENFSPYHFKPALYEKILPAIKLGARQESNQQPEVYAFKLATLFSSEQEIDRYLRDYVTRWRPDTEKPFHDACLFELPERDKWNANNWKNLLLDFGPETFPLLKAAPRIETQLGDIPFPQALPEILLALSYNGFKRKDENPTLAALSGHFNFDQEAFNKMLDFTQQQGKTTDYIPAVRVDGDRIGYPGYYMERLAPNDPMGFFLGLVDKNGCQYWDGNGHPCVVYGMSSPYSGFYVWRRKGTVPEDKLTPEDPDPIVAHSWVWIGEDNMLVYDSYERTKAIYNPLVQPFLEQLAFEVTGKYSFDDNGVKKTIAGVRLGCDSTGQTPALPLPKSEAPSNLINYDGKYDDNTDARDSIAQYVITPVDHASNPQPKLPQAVVPPELEQAALRYIEHVTTKLRDRYGIKLELMINLEFYATQPDNTALGFLDKHEIIGKELEAAGIQHVFPTAVPSKDDQFRLVGTIAEPLEMIRSITAARKMLQENAKKYGYGAFIFWPRPFKSKEWSAAEISAVLGPEDGKTMTLGGFPTLADLCEHAAGHLVAFNAHSILACVQTDMDYARLWNSARAPDAIRTGNKEDDKAGIKISYIVDGSREVYYYLDDSKNEVEIDYNLATASANLPLAVAGMLAGIEYALDQTLDPLSTRAGHNSNRQPEVTEKGFPLPKNRYEALLAMKKGDQLGLFNAAAQDLFQKVARLHEPQRVEPGREMAGTDIHP